MIERPREISSRRSPWRGLPLADHHAAFPFDRDRGSAVEEESRLEQARDRVERAIERGRIRQWTDLAIDEEVAVLAELRATTLEPGKARNAQLLEPAAHRGRRERQYLDRQPAARPELGVALLRTDEAHDPACARRDDLFPPNCAPVSPNEATVGVHLVGAIDREVDPQRVVERDERDAEGAREVRGRARRRDAAHFEARRDPIAQRAHETLRGAPGPEAYDVARPDLVQRIALEGHVALPYAPRRPLAAAASTSHSTLASARRR